MRLIMLLVLLTLSASASAEIYKWVDEAGKVHFSDTPPVPDQAEPVQLPPQPSEASLARGRADIARRLQYQQDDDTARREAAEKKKQEREQQQRLTAERGVRCAFARDQLKVLATQAPVFRENEEGEREYADDAFRSAEKARFTAEVAQYCD
jgi:hypothetical protein